MANDTCTHFGMCIRDSENDRTLVLCVCVCSFTVSAWKNPYHVNWPLLIGFMTLVHISLSPCLDCFDLSGQTASIVIWNLIQIKSRTKHKTNSFFRTFQIEFHFFFLLHKHILFCTDATYSLARSLLFLRLWPIQVRTVIFRLAHFKARLYLNFWLFRVLHVIFMSCKSLNVNFFLVLLFASDYILILNRKWNSIVAVETDFIFGKIPYNHTPITITQGRNLNSINHSYSNHSNHSSNCH